MTRDDKCREIIKKASIKTAAIGFIPLLSLERKIVESIREEMVNSIAKEYKINLKEISTKNSTDILIKEKKLTNLISSLIAGNILTNASETEKIGQDAMDYFRKLELEYEKKISFDSGFKSGVIKTEEKFNNILKKLNENDMDNFLIVVIFKYIMTREGYIKYTIFNKGNYQIYSLINIVNEEFCQNFTLKNIEDIINDWRGKNKSKGKKEIYAILKKATDLFKWENFYSKKYLEIIKYVEENM